MNLKNYTSTVPVERSVAAIERVLVDIGAYDIAKTYDRGGTKRLIGINFQAVIGDRRLVFRLPARADHVCELMCAEMRRPRKGTRDRIAEQAERTAWRLMHDWVSVQASMIRLQQADLVEIFLPYLFDGGHTFYERLREHGFKQLGAGYPSDATPK